MLLRDDKADQEGRKEILASTCSLATQSCQTGCLRKTGRLGFFKIKKKEEVAPTRSLESMANVYLEPSVTEATQQNYI